MTVRLFLRDAGAAKLLTREEEVALAKDIELAQERILTQLAHLPEIVAATDQSALLVSAIHEETQEKIGQLMVAARRLAGRPRKPGDKSRRGLVRLLRASGLAGRRRAPIVQHLRAEAERPRARHLKRALAEIDAAEIEEQRAVKRFTLANLRLVVSVAQRCRKRAASLELLDLVQEGTLGLMRAVETFDHRRGYKFSTYAVWWIRQSIARGLQETDPTIRLPMHISEVLVRVHGAGTRLQGTLGRPPTDDELAHAAGLSADRVAELALLPRTAASLDTPVGGEDTSPLEQTIADARVEDPIEAILLQEREGSVRSLLSALEPREARIVALRFGLHGGGEPETLEQIGTRFSLTRERIRQIEKRALGKLMRLAAGRPQLAP